MSAPLEPMAAYGQEPDTGPVDECWWPDAQLEPVARGAGKASPEPAGPATADGAAGDGPIGDPDWRVWREHWVEPDPVLLSYARLEGAAKAFRALALAVIVGIALYQTIRDALQSRQDASTGAGAGIADFLSEVMDAQREGQDIQVTAVPDVPPAAPDFRPPKKSHHKSKADGGVG